MGRDGLSRRVVLMMSGWKMTPVGVDLLRRIIRDADINRDQWENA